MKKQLNKKELVKTNGGIYRPFITIDGTVYAITECIETTDLQQEYLAKAGIKIREGMKIAIIGPAGSSKTVLRKTKVKII